MKKKNDSLNFHSYFLLLLLPYILNASQYARFFEKDTSSFFPSASSDNAQSLDMFHSSSTERNETYPSSYQSFTSNYYEEDENDIPFDQKQFEMFLSSSTEAIACYASTTDSFVESSTAAAASSFPLLPCSPTLPLLEEETEKKTTQEEISKTSTDDSSTCLPPLNPPSSFHPSKKSFICPWPVCNKNFTRGNSLKKHLKRIHPSETYDNTHSDSYKCIVCFLTFPTYNDLIFHKRTHPKAKTYQCGSCDQAFTYQYSLTRHELLFHQPHDDTAGHQTDSLALDDKTDKKKDKKIKPLSSERTYHISTCPYCNKSFPPSRLTNHLCIHTKEKPYVCHKETCGRKFAQKSNLTKHIKRIHTKDEEKRFICQTCQKGFIYPSDFAIHRNIHPNQKT